MYAILAAQNMAIIYDVRVSRNPPAIPADTTPEVWRMQMDALARRTPADRLAEWEVLDAAIAEMEAEGVRRRHPTYGERVFFLALVRRRYGDVLFAAA